MVSHEHVPCTPARRLSVSVAETSMQNLGPLCVMLDFFVTDAIESFMCAGYGGVVSSPAGVFPPVP